MIVATILALAPAAQASPVEPGDGPADLVVLGRVFTADEATPWAEAVAVRGTRIVAVGTRADVAPLLGAETRRVDAGDASVLPGFNDAHCHFTVGYGMPYELDLAPARSLDELLALVEAHVAAHPEEEIVQGLGWNLGSMPGGHFPDAGLLDTIESERPVLLWSEGPHAVWTNTAAMERAGIDAEMKDPPGIRFERDEYGAPTGVFLGGVRRLFRYLSLPDLEDMQAGILRGLEEAPRFGVTSVHDSVPSLLLPFLAQLHDEGRLTVRFHVWGSPHVSPFGGGLEEHFALEEEHGRENWITFGTLKTGVDGMPSLRTAAMLEPYSDDAGNRGLWWGAPETLPATVREANARGLRVAVHATGDAGVRAAAEAFRAEGAEAELRNRVEHAFVVSPEDRAELAASRAVVSVQPGFLPLDLAHGRFYESRFGPERMEHVLPLRSLLDAGVTLAFGTDFSLTPIDPRVGLFAAVTRRTLDGHPAEGWVSEERITLAEALRAYTIGSAVAEGAETVKGTLRPGRLADLVVFSGDVFADPESIRELEVVLTVVDGRVVYER